MFDDLKQDDQELALETAGDESSETSKPPACEKQRQELLEPAVELGLKAPETLPIKGEGADRPKSRIKGLALSSQYAASRTALGRPSAPKLILGQYRRHNPLAINSTSIKPFESNEVFRFPAQRESGNPELASRHKNAA